MTFTNQQLLLMGIIGVFYPRIAWGILLIIVLFNLLFT